MGISTCSGFRLCLSMGLVVLFWAGPARAEEPPDPCGASRADAQSLANAGLRIYREAQALPEGLDRVRALERAVRCYQLAQQASKRGAEKLNHPLGLAFEKLGRDVEAVEAFERFLQTVPEIERRPGVTKQIQDKLKVLRRGLGQIAVETVAGLPVRVDERRVGSSPLGRLVVVAPGSHVVTVGDEGRGTLGTEVQVHAGEVRRVDLTAWRPRSEAAPLPAQAVPAQAVPAQAMTATVPVSTPRKTPVYKRWWFWGTVGLVVAGAVTGAVVGTTFNGEGKADTGTVYPVRF